MELEAEVEDVPEEIDLCCLIGHIVLEVAGLLERTGCRIADMGLVHTVEEVGELVVVQDGSWLWFLRKEIEMFHSC